MTMIGLPKTEGIVIVDLPAVNAQTPEVIEVDGKQYAKLPEGWPAAEAKDLEEAHAEAVVNDEPKNWEDEILDIYATFTPDEVRELCEDWVRLVKEVAALRKGMKTMQRKTRKQNQVQRRLERRLSQARSRRDALLKDEDAARTINKYMQSLAEMAAGAGVVVRGGE